MRDRGGRFVSCEHTDRYSDGRCRICTKANRAKHRAKHIEKIRARGREWMRTFGRWRKFGLTGEQYAVLAAQHGGMCAICQEEEVGSRQLCIDHDHATDKVRGLLCDKCNKGLGHFRDSAELLRRAAVYLELPR